MSHTVPVVFFLPGQRDVGISVYGRNSSKLGPNVLDYSRMAGGPRIENLRHNPVVQHNSGGTCPGSTDECEAICYAKRVKGIVGDIIWPGNSTDHVPPIPAGRQRLRLHVGGDFDTVEYISAWFIRLRERPDVTAWAYTRSWRVPDLLPALEALRALPNVQLFASMDPSLPDEPSPKGWRRAWIWRDEPNNQWPREARLRPICNRCNGTGEYEGEYGPRPCMPCVVGFRPGDSHHMFVTTDGGTAYVCPEETGRKQNCEECRYCFDGRKHDVVFLEHHGATS